MTEQRLRVLEELKKEDMEAKVHHTHLPTLPYPPTPTHLP